MIRKITARDKSLVADMMKVFYASDAVSTNGSAEIFENDIESCINGDPYVEGYVFENKGELQGYAMLAKSYSTEFGRHCIWVEDIYIKPEYRGLGLAKAFFDFLSEVYPDHVLRLEVEDYNTRAVKVYESAGFDTLPYVEMIKICKK